MKKTILLLCVLLILALLLSACVQESVVPTEPTSSPTTETPTGPTTEPTAEQIYTLADLDFNQMHYSGGTPEGYYPFICADDKKERTLEWILEKNTDEVVQLLKDFTPGYVYLMDIDTQEFICIIDEPMIAKHDTSDYLFCITAENTLIVTDMTGTVRVELYRAVEPLGVKSLGYWRTSLYFIEGSSIMNMDLLTGEIKKLIEYEGAIDADPLYGIDEEFPHLMYIKTETEDVACNLETGETAIIPETGQWGTAAFDQYLGYGVWPEPESPTEPLTGPARQEGQRLTAEDLERFERMFARYGDYYSFPPTNYYNMALSHTYETVEEMQISTFFNDGCGDNLGEELTQEEYDFFCNKIGFEISKDIIRYPADEVKWVLDYYLGKTPEEVKVGMVYNPNTDCYYTVPAGAFTMPSMYLHFHDGYFDPETGKVSLYYYFYVNDEERVITLQSKEWVGEAGYYIVSNVTVSSQD